MAKLDLVDIVSLENQPSAIQALQYNFDLIKDAVENTLSRDGTAPNQLEASLDFNSQRALNLPEPRSANEPARLVDLQNVATPAGVVFPALVPGRVLSNDGTILTWSVGGFGDLVSTNNLSDLASPSTARANLGLGTAAVAAIGVSGDAVGKLNANLTWSGTHTYSGLVTMTGGVEFGGAANYRLTTTADPTENSIGFRGVPLVTADSTYSFVLNNIGKHVLHTSASAHAWTINPQTTTAWPNGSIIMLVNVGAGVVTVTRGSGVQLRIAGSSTDKNVALAQHGVATLFRASSDIWYIMGSGIS